MFWWWPLGTAGKFTGKEHQDGGGRASRGGPAGGRRDTEGVPVVVLPIPVAILVTLSRAQKRVVGQFPVIVLKQTL